MTTDRSFQILASSDDPLLLLGLEAILAPFPDLELVASCPTGAIALALLAQVFLNQTALNEQQSSNNSNDSLIAKSKALSNKDNNANIHLTKKEFGSPNQFQNQSTVDDAEAIPDGVADSTPDRVGALGRPPLVPDRSSSVPPSNLDLVILDLDQGSPEGNTISGINLYHQIASQYPQVPILLLSSFTEPPPLVTSGAAKGYCSKRGDPKTLVSVIRACAARQTYWPPPRSAPHGRSGSKEADRWSQSRPTSGLGQPSPSPHQRSIVPKWLADLAIQPRQRMDAEVADLDALLRQPSISAWDRFFLSGRRREVLVARWLVNQVLGLYPWGRGAGELQRREEGQLRRDFPPSPEAPDAPSPEAPLGDVAPSPLAPVPSAARVVPVDVTVAKGLQAALFEATLDKLAQTQLRNLTDVALEIDILRQEKKQELCFLILRQLEDLLSKLRFSQVAQDQLRMLQRGLLRDLWVDTTTEFFGKYTSVLVGDRQLEIVPVLLQDYRNVHDNILEKIPLVEDLFSHLLFQTPLTVDNESYSPGTLEAMQQAEFLLHNLTLRVANATIQPLLNRFADVEEIKQNFYDRRWISTREIERFRNNLSWKYRWEKYWREPKAIFESQYLLVVIDDRGIKNRPVYGARNQELVELNGVQQAVTLLLETRDAISPRVRSILLGIGSGSRYLLLQLGRGIGFIGQGIMQGIGTSLADIRKGQQRRED